MRLTANAAYGVVFLLIAALLCALAPSSVFAGQNNEIRGIRFWSGEEHTRVVIDLSDDAVFSESRIMNPERVFVDLKRSVLPSSVNDTISVGDGVVQGIRAAQYDQQTVRVVLDLQRIEGYKVFRLSGPARIVIDLYGQGTATAVAKQDAFSSGSAEEKAKRIAEAKRFTEEKKRLLEEQRIEEERKLAEEQRLAEERRLAQEKMLAEEQKLAEERKLAEAKKLAENRRVAEEQRLAEERRLAVEKRLAEEKAEARAEKLARVEKVAKSKADDVEVSAAAKSKSLSPKPEDLRAIKPRVRVVVIDAGHGGRDPGAIGPGDVKEKDVVLDVAKRIKKGLEAKGGYEVHLTREKDKYLSLEERSIAANEKGADLFISIHANAHNNKSVNGLETYFLRYTDEKEALKVAARENKISVRRMQKQRNDTEVLLASLQVSNNAHESVKIAGEIQDAMVSRVGKRYPKVKDLGVKGALFYVLVGVEMPSALVEISFITNPTEAKRLKSNTYREHLARGISKGVETYFEKQGPEQKIAMRQ